MARRKREPNDADGSSDADAYEKKLAAIVVGGPQRLSAPIEILPYDPTWPVTYGAEAERLRGVLGDRIVRLEHCGSTSVPGLPAKPIIDMVLEVADSADEAAYVSDLERGGYTVAIREPDWFEHRVCKGPGANINLHIFSAGCPETDRMLSFRDWLRIDIADRERYATVKRELASRPWTYVQQYADAKGEVVAEIMARATAHAVDGSRTHGDSTRRKKSP